MFMRYGTQMKTRTASKTRSPSGTLIGIIIDAFKRLDSKIRKVEIKVSREWKQIVYTTPISDITFFSWQVTFSLPYCNSTLPIDVHRNSLFKFVIFFFISNCMAETYLHTSNYRLNKLRCWIWSYISDAKGFF